MSGILDKKSRIFDYIITSNGRKQIQNNDIRFKYVTLSDRSIVYNKDFENEENELVNVSNSEFFYLPLESSYKTNVDINDEFSFEEQYENKFTITNNSLSINDVNFDNFIKEQINDKLFGSKFINLKNLLTKNLLLNNIVTDFKIENLNENDFKNSENIERYSSLIKFSEDYSGIKPVALDDRFKHKNNFKVLLPFDSINGNEVFSRDLFNNINVNNNNILFKSLNKNLNIDNLNRNQILNKITNYIENNNTLIGKKYYLKDKDDIDTFFIEMHEINNIDNENIDVSKLSFIDLGEIFDNIKNISKRIFLIGKFIQTSDSTNDTFSGLLFENNNGILDKELSNSNIFIGSYYSFINMFTLIIE